MTYDESMIAPPIAKRLKREGRPLGDVILSPSETFMAMCASKDRGERHCVCGKRISRYNRSERCHSCETGLQR